MSSLVSKIDQLLSVLLLEELAPFALTNIPPKLSAFLDGFFFGFYSDDSDALSFCSVYCSL